MKYTKPELKISVFDSSNIVTTSETGFNDMVNSTNTYTESVSYDNLKEAGTNLEFKQW